MEFAVTLFTSNGKHDENRFRVGEMGSLEIKLMDALSPHIPAGAAAAANTKKLKE